MKITFIIAYTVVMLLLGLGSYVFGLDSMQNIGRLNVRLYVFNDKTQLWDRAREETIKNIRCDKLRGMNLPSNEEYLIDKE